MEQLQHFYPSLTYHSLLPDWNEELYLFLNEKEKSWLSIPKSQLPEKDYTFFSLLFKEIKTQSEWKSENLNNWQFKNDYPKKGRCIYFYFDKLQDEANFRMIVKQFFPDLLLYKTSANSFFIFSAEIIEEDLLAINEIIQTDLYTSVKIIIGFHTIHPSKECLFHFINLEQTIMTAIQPTLHTNSIINLEHLAIAINYYCNKKTLSELYKLLFQHVYSQKEIIESVSAYIYNQCNLTLTSKKLFIHRNTLLYRIQKFEELTSIKVNSFESCLLISNAIFYLKSMHKM